LFKEHRMTTAANSTRPIRSIVVATDFTPCSGVALAQAIRIVAWSGAAVRVVHVIDTTVVIELETALSSFQQAIRDNLVRDAERAWADFAAKVPGGGAAGLPIEVSINNRIVGILKRAREDKADLLVVGAFGDRTPDVGMGTVATACVRKSMTDVLLVRDTSLSQGKPAGFRTVVAAVDFSETSALALERAALFAASDGAELHVLHVFAAPWHRLHYRAPTPLAPEHLQKQYRDGLERRLADFARPIADAYPGVRLRTVCYDYNGHRSGIVEYAKSVSADLIALGTRGTTNLRDLLLGSTAEKALEESPCSILAVKPKGFEHPLAKDEEPRMMQLRHTF
jgi:nucleotide-binding universal stress UspA family protein